MSPKKVICLFFEQIYKYIHPDLFTVRNVAIQIFRKTIVFTIADNL